VLHHSCYETLQATSVWVTGCSHEVLVTLFLDVSERWGGKFSCYKQFEIGLKILSMLVCRRRFSEILFLDATNELLMID